MLNAAEACLDTCLANHRLKLVYAYVPKAACTSIKTWLIRSARFARPLAAALDDAEAAALVPGTIAPSDAAYPDVHTYLDEHHSLRRLSRPQALSILRDPAYFKFTFVRHPLARLVSAYLDKVVRVEPCAYRVIRAHQFRAGRLGWQAARDWLRGEPFLDAKRSLTFREFVNQLLRENPERLDPHFRSQARLLRGIPLNFVGRVEQIARDFAVVQRRLKCFVPLAKSNGRQYGNDRLRFCVADWEAPRFRSLAAAPAWPLFYDAALQEQVAALYATDLARFGYLRGLEANVQHRAA